VCEPASDIGVTVARQHADQGFADRGILGEIGPDTGNGVHGKPFARPQRQIGAGSECPAQQHRGMVREADDGFGGCGRVPECRLPDVVRGGLVGAVAGGARQQIAVGARALRVVHERRLFTVADQAPLRGRQPLTGDQCRQYGRVRGLVGRHRAADLGMGMRRKPGGHVRRGPRREFHDDSYVRVRGERLHHIGREAGAGCQFLPALGVLVRCKEARPLRAMDGLVEQGESGLRLCHRIDVGGGQPARANKPHRAVLVARGQRHRLRRAEIRAAREVCGNVRVRDRDQPVEQFGRQGRIGSEPAQDMVHGRHPARTATEWLADFDVGQWPAAPGAPLRLGLGDGHPAGIGDRRRALRPDPPMRQ
jgi:hypothetical protein